jgi:hypothetical protein
MSKLGFAEGRSNLVFHHLDFGAVAGDRFAVFDGRDAADIEADRRIELERAPTGGGFGIAEHHADLLADLVNENQAGIRFGDRSREFAHGLRHQAGLQAHMGIAHLAIEFRPIGASRKGTVHLSDMDADARRIVDSSAWNADTLN